MAPSGVSPNAQAIMGAIKRWYDRINFTQIATGTANTYAVTYDIPPQQYVLGDIYSFIVGPGLTNTSASTFNANSIGQVDILVNGNALQGGELVQNCIAVIAYDSTGNFQLLNPFGRIFGNETITGNLTVQGNENLTGNLGITGNMDVTGGTIMTELVATAETVGTLQVTGTTELQGPVEITGNQISFGGGAVSFLPSATSYYISTTGNDSTGNGTSGNPWLTAQHAYNVITGANTVFGTNVITLIHEPGTYSSTNTWFSPTTGNWVLQSSTGISADVVISITGTNQDGIHPNLGPCNVLVQYMTVQAASGYCLSSNGNASLVLNQVNVGTTSFNQIAAYDGGYIEIIGGYVIIGGANAHYFADHGTIIASQSAVPITVTSLGSVAITGEFAQIAATGYLRCVSGTYSGITMTGGGIQYAIIGNGVVESGGEAAATFFPPFNSTGTTATGGQWL